jgi:hypothetical protein
MLSQWLLHFMCCDYKYFMKFVQICATIYYILNIMMSMNRKHL